MCLVVGTACDSDDNGETNGDGDTAGDGDGDGDTAGDGDGDTAGDGDGDTAGDGDGDSSGDGDGDGDTNTAGDLCEELAMGDALIPADCQCTDPGAPCMQGCHVPDGMTTCDSICAGVGQACVPGACAGGTYLEGPDADECPVPSEYGSVQDIACDEPIPVIEADWADGPLGALCCCSVD